MEDYSFMKTGIMNSLDSIPDLKPEIVISAFVYLLELCVCDAALYSEHAKRGENVLLNDITLSAKYNAIHFFTREDIELKCQEIMDEMNAYVEEEDAEEKEDAEEEVDADNEVDAEEKVDADNEVDTEEKGDAKEEEEWTQSECTCNVCSNLNSALESWEKWNPSDPLEIVMKEVIEQITLL